MSRTDNARGSQWLSLRRGLVILKRLLRGPASPSDLIQFVYSELGGDAYGVDPRPAFKRDRENLRTHLGVDFGYDPSANEYTLHHPGQVFLLELSDEGLEGLGFLLEQFSSAHDPPQHVRTLLDELLPRLPGDRQRRLERRQAGIEMPLTALDEQPISKRVWDTAERAVRTHREMGFDYLSPAQVDGQPRYHRVAPIKLEFRRGHWYLQAIGLFWRNPFGQQGYDLGFQRYRLRYMRESENLAVLAGQVNPNKLRIPQIPVRYVLHPPVSRGDISRHFAQMKVTRLDSGDVEVSGTTDDAWDAVRTLLGYGESCTVLGGEQVRALMLRRVGRMLQRYED